MTTVCQFCIDTHRVSTPQSTSSLITKFLHHISVVIFMYTVHMQTKVLRLATNMSLRLLFLAFFTLTYVPLAVPTSASGSGLEPAAGKVDMYCMLPIRPTAHYAITWRR